MSSLRGVHVRHTQLLLKFTALVIFPTAFLTAANKIDKHINQYGCGQSESEGRVYNGEPTARENMPWIVQVSALYDSGVLTTCGGSIITSNVILTAAHCLRLKGVFREKVYVWLNSTRSYDVRAVMAEMMIVHPRFVKNSEYVYDIALLKLAVDINFSRVMKPVCLPEEDVDVAGKALVISGWGHIQRGKESKTLLQASIFGMTDEACHDLIKSSINPFTKRLMKPGPMVCAKGPTSNTCLADSGGPLTLRDYEGRSMQVGIASLTLGCAANKASMYARVAFHVKWIQKMLNHPGKWMKLQYDRETHDINVG